MSKTPFEYSVLHYIHDLVTEEFLNIGIALYSKEKRFFAVRFLTRYSRLTEAFPGVEGDFYREYIGGLERRFEKLSREINTPQANFKYELPEKISQILSSVLPTDDSSIVFDAPKVGIADDIEAVFNELYTRLVEKYLQKPKEFTRSDEDVWSLYSKPLRSKNIIARLAPHVVKTPNDNLEFDYAYKNGRWSLFQPISLDLKSADSIKKKARLWLGNQMVLKQSEDVVGLYLLLGKPSQDDPILTKAYENAKEILLQEQVEYTRKLVEEDQIEGFTEEVNSLTKDH